MASYIVTRALSVGGGRRIEPGELLPLDIEITYDRLRQLSEQGYLQAMPDEPGSAGAELVAGVLAGIAALPGHAFDCAPESQVGNYITQAAMAAADVERLAERLTNLRGRLAVARSEIGAADEHSDLRKLAPAVVAVQVFSPLIAQLEAEHRAAVSTRDTARREANHLWSKAQDLTLRLKAHAHLYGPTELETLRATIEQLIGWPEPAPAAAAA